MVKNSLQMLSYSNSSNKTYKSADVILTIQYKDNPILKSHQNGKLIYDGYLLFLFPPHSDL
ncbi:hypothetical protein FMK67_19435 [Klebsiella michiganensis]|nr:hypothetical protein C2U46_29745 [Klebsiella oxytoca]EUB40092.1 hypothetical protein HMPREF1502_1843 [Klebsiella sp. AS10]MBZ6666308.1 hypothetical protein [Klebsiella michiganensis]MBZ6746399.1 hypothetical protein [Klebsiella michiganensis]MBZ7236771.1 hypothetical protein [Klebsiella michiganensis]